MESFEPSNNGIIWAILSTIIHCRVTCMDMNPTTFRVQMYHWLVKAELNGIRNPLPSQQVTSGQGILQHQDQLLTGQRTWEQQHQHLARAFPANPIVILIPSSLLRRLIIVFTIIKISSILYPQHAIWKENILWLTFRGIKRELPCWTNFQRKTSIFAIFTVLVCGTLVKEEK